MKHNELDQAWMLLEEAMMENKAANPPPAQNGKKEEAVNGNAQNGQKRKLEEENGDDVAEPAEEPAKKKKKKEEPNGLEEPLVEEVSPDKFSWGETIRNILSAKNNELKLKKLRSKVVKKYQSLTGGEWSEKVENKFNKKINKLKGVVVEDEKVRLIE